MLGPQDHFRLLSLEARFPDELLRQGRDAQHLAEPGLRALAIEQDQRHRGERVRGVFLETKQGNVQCPDDHMAELVKEREANIAEHERSICRGKSRRLRSIRSRHTRGRSRATDREKQNDSASRDNAPVVYKAVSGNHDLLIANRGAQGQAWIRSPRSKSGLDESQFSNVPTPILAGASCRAHAGMPARSWPSPGSQADMQMGWMLLGDFLERQGEGVDHDVVGVFDEQV